MGNGRSLSFYDWCFEAKRPYLLNYYSKANPTPLQSQALIWDSEEVVEWVCPRQHLWKTRLCDYTTNPSTRFHECPICERIKNTVNPEELKKQITSIIAQIKSGVIFLCGYEEYESNIKFVFRHPFGKYDDIAIYLSKTEGILEQLSFNTYSLTYHPKNIKQILRMYFCMDSMQYGHLNEGFVCDYTQAKDYLAKFCLYFHLQTLLSELSLFHEPYDENSLIQQSSRFYRDCLKIERQKVRNIYDEMIRSGENIGRWKAEQELFSLISSQYSDAIFQYRSEWLGSQSLDIFIPSISTGFEYQGAQHYEPIKFFGGQPAFEERIKLDKRKKKLCMQNGVRLIEWKWTEEITLEVLHQKLLAQSNEMPL